MKFTQWKNLRIDPTQPEMTIQEKFVAFGFFGVPALATLLIAHSLGSSNSMHWAIAGLFLGVMLTLQIMHPKTATADWKRLFLINGLPMLVAPALLDLGAEFWSFAVAATVYFGMKFYYKQTKKTEEVLS